MLPSVATLTSICEDVCDSIKIEQNDLKPFNRQLINEEYLNLNHINTDGNFTNSSLYCPTTNLKQLFRFSHLNVSHTLRSSLWYNLLRQDHVRHQHKFQQAVERYPEDIRNMFGRRNDIIVRLPSCVDADHLPHYNLNRRGQHAVTRILSVFSYYHPDITWAPLLAPITALFLHYMTEIDAYESLLILTSNNYKIITQTEIQYQSLTLAFRTILRRHCRTTYDILLKQSQLSSTSSIFDEWLWIIFEHLPFSYLVPIIDCLLIEDMKILLRISMTLYHFFVKYGLNQHILNNNNKPPSRRRESLFRRSKSSRQSGRFQSQSTLVSTKSNVTIYDNLITYIQHFDLPLEKLFKHAFGIHHLQRKEIYRAVEKKRMSRHASGLGRKVDKIHKALVSSSLFKKLHSIEEEKIKVERRRVIPLLHHSISNHDHHVANIPVPSKTIITRPLHHQNSIPIIMIKEFDTTTASHSDFAYLWSLIPNRLADFQPERIYSSNIHGRRLRTLYDHVEYHEYCLIIIRNEYQQIFGCFCAGQLANRTKTRAWFGTGESFLFTLKPERHVYKWVGYQTSTQGSTKPYEDYFIYADDERLQFGGSKEPLHIGLSIQQDLNEGSTNQCDTFDSKALSTSEHFQIMEIEVFGFAR